MNKTRVFLVVLFFCGWFNMVCCMNKKKSDGDAKKVCNQRLSQEKKDLVKNDAASANVEELAAILLSLNKPKIFID